MSTPEQTPQDQTQTQTPQAQSEPDPANGDIIGTYGVQLVKRYTGATHYVQGGSSVDLVRHGETGEPETEYALLGDIDGVQVTLWSGNAGRIDTQVAALQQRQKSQQQV